MDILELEHLIQISQFEFSHERNRVAKSVTAYNKKAKTNGEPKMTIAYLLRKNLPNFVTYLESLGIDIEKDIANNFRTPFGNVTVTIPPSVKDSDLKMKWLMTSRSTYLSYFFQFEYLSHSVAFKCFDNIYKPVVRSQQNTHNIFDLTLNGDPNFPRLDVSKFLIMLQE